MSAFSHYFKRFCYCYHVTIAPYNSKSSSRYYVCLDALILAYFQRAPVHSVRLQVHSYYHQLSHGFATYVVGIFAWMSADEEESDRLISCFDLK